MRDLMAELKKLRLYGMAAAWAELTVQGESNTASSKWLMHHCHIVETGNESSRLQHSSLTARAMIKSRERKRKGGQDPEDDEPF